ncbi:hypothetical protein [Terasakiella pusilla]|uniref:hypothetical protein n=1 Tax=Terasakiella pusilla TaxID=64973 RepID=UPI0012EBA8EC|nr:hypothetical protein [Terasakiella pusilla]
MRKNTSHIGKSFETAVNNFFIKHPGIQIEELENLISPSFAIDGIGAATGLNGWKNGLIAYEIIYVKNFNALERSIHNIFSKLPVGKHGEFPSILVFQEWLPKIQKFSFDWK